MFCVLQTTEHIPTLTVKSVFRKTESWSHVWCADEATVSCLQAQYSTDKYPYLAWRWTWFCSECWG